MTQVLIVGEICVDYTLASAEVSPKIRLGGIVHAARGLWAAGIPYAVAAICPEYLVYEAQQYLKAHDCLEFIRLGNVTGAPNVFIIGDARETGPQGYENLLRDEKNISFLDVDKQLKAYTNVVIFPGSFPLHQAINYLSPTASITIDIAYDIEKLDELKSLRGKILTLAISTSSELFKSVAQDSIDPLILACKEVGAQYLLLKENRGGSRFFNIESGKTQEVPATLGDTVNSVGVGDVYTAVLTGRPEDKPEDAVWRGMQAATKYAQTTFPDDLKRDIQREFKLDVSEVRQLGGVYLPWHERQKFQIYLAAPDFSYENTKEIERAVSSLEYHNFKVRRPIKENGEAPEGTVKSTLSEFYYKDVDLLKECALIFAIPLRRDPGTLVEIGLAIEMNLPVITYDPHNENNNTMVICGSYTYSNDLDLCLNGVYESLATIRKGLK